MRLHRGPSSHQSQPPRGPWWLTQCPSQLRMHKHTDTDGNTFGYQLGGDNECIVRCDMVVPSPNDAGLDSRMP